MVHFSGFVGPNLGFLLIADTDLNPGFFLVDNPGLVGLHTFTAWSVLRKTDIEGLVSL